LTVTEFTKHIHTNQENVNEDDKSSNKSFNILPYRTKSQITEYDKSTWRLFSKRFAEYKRDRLFKRERQRSKQKISNKNRNKCDSFSLFKNLLENKGVKWDESFTKYFET
jgi:glucan phosphorylase